MQERLTALMEEQGLKAATLSIEAGLGRTAVRDILERTTRSPEYFTVAKLADRLGVTPDYLVGRSNDREADFEALSSQDRRLHAELALTGSDHYMARVLEDVIELLCGKDAFSKDKLPPPARKVLKYRQHLRRINGIKGGGD